MKRSRFHLAVRHPFRHWVNAFFEGWYVRGDAMSSDRARLLCLNYTANITANLIGGTFFTGLLLYMQASDSFIGAMTMISVGANMLQVLAPMLLERFPRRKKILTVLRVVLQVFNILIIGFIPIFPIAQRAKLVLVTLSVLITNLINALISPGTSIWHIQSVPPHQRNAYFTRVTMTVGAVVAVANLLGSKLVDSCRAAGNEYAGLLALRLIAFALVVLDTIVFMRRIREYPYGQHRTRFSIHSLFVLPLREKRYLKTIIIAVMWHFSANIPGPFFQVYLLKDLGVNYSYIMLVNLFNLPAVILLTPVWSRLLRRLTWFQALATAMSFYLLHYLMLSLVTGTTMYLYPIACILAFVMAPGINLSFTNIPYINMPAENQTVYMGFYTAVCNLAALAGVGAGRALVGNTHGLSFDVFGLLISNKQYVLWLTALAMIIGVIVIYALDRSLRRQERLEEDVA